MSSDALRSYLRTLRTEQWLTQRQLAQRVGVREQLIAAYERGEVGSLKDSVLLRIAATLHATLEDMVALETGQCLEEVDGRQWALRRVACLRAVHPVTTVTITVRMFASEARAVRIDQSQLSAHPISGTRVYEGQCLPGTWVQILVNGQPINKAV